MGELKNRERVNMTLPRDLMEQLRAMSEKTNVPVSRYVESAVKEKIEREK